MSEILRSLNEELPNKVSASKLNILSLHAIRTIVDSSICLSPVLVSLGAERTIVEENVNHDSSDTRMQYSDTIPLNS